MNGQYAIDIPFPSPANSFCMSKEHPYFLNLTYAGDTTMYASNKVMSVKATFIMNQGLFKPRVMFFGLMNSPAMFQTMMNAIFAEELHENWLTIYMDDIQIHTSDDIISHREKVHKILQKLRQHDLYLKPEKCQFEQKRVEFLGVILEKETVQMDLTKTKGIADWKTPQNLKDVHAFLQFTGFYRYFVPNYSKIARPLIKLMKKRYHFTGAKHNSKRLKHSRH